MIKQFSKKQSEILRFGFNDKRFLICDGAVRSGKTIVMTIAYIVWAMEVFNNTNFAVCAKTVSNAERNIITPLITTANLPYRIEYHRAAKTLTVSMQGKTNRFYLFGGKDEAAYQLIQGITLAGVLLDEVALMPRSFVEQALSRTLTYDNAKVWFNCNPEGQLHWFNQEWVIPADEGRKADVEHLHFLMSDNPIMSEETIERTKSMFSGVFYDRYILGLWVAAEGLIYDMFEPSRHVGTTETHGEYYVSCDFGMQNATVFLLWHKSKTEQWCVVDEWYYSGREERKQKTVSELVDGLKSMLRGIEPKQVIIDPSAAALIEELRRNGYKTRQADNDVLDGIADVATILNEDRILISPSCKNTINEFGVYRWDEKASEHGEDRPIKENDHAMDAVRYFVKTMKLVRHARQRNTDDNYYSNLLG